MTVPTWRLQAVDGVVDEVTQQPDVVASLTADLYSVQHAGKAALVRVNQIYEPVLQAGTGQ